MKVEKQKQSRVSILAEEKNNTIKGIRIQYPRKVHATLFLAIILSH